MVILACFSFVAVLSLLTAETGLTISPYLYMYRLLNFVGLLCKISPKYKTVDVEFIAGHIAYLSMLMIEVYHTHPVLKTFVELLNRTRANQLNRETAGLVLSNLFHANISNV